MRLAKCQRVKLLKWLAISDHNPNIRGRIRAKDADARHIGERSDAVLRTAIAGHDDIDRTLAAELRYIESGWRAADQLLSLCAETIAGKPMKEISVVHSDPNILGGTPVFVGTRVPVQALIDYIEGGHSLNAFLDDFPTVTRDMAIAALEQAKAHLIADASAA